jgi:aspartyl-tRNA synthetase
MFKEGKHPSLETLIARFGGSTNTAWTDRGYEIWRHPPTGFAIGFVDAKGHAVTWGAPLCPPDRVGEVIRGYIDWCRQDRKLGLIWANADDKTEQVLVNEHHWKALAVTSEQRLDPSAVLNVESKHLDKKVRQARAAGVTINIIKGEVTEDLRLEIDAGIQKWLEGRKGTQIHTTSLRPWAIVEHRTYFVARDKEQKASDNDVCHF